MEWDLDYWTHLAQGQYVEAVEEEPAALVDRDQVVQSQEGDTPPTVPADATIVVTDQPVATTITTEQPIVMEQGAEQGVGYKAFWMFSFIIF